MSKKILAACVLTLMSGAVFAQSGHYVRLAAEVNPNTGCLEVTLKEAGLGNSGVEAVSYALTADATFTVVCVTRTGNEIQGQPKSGSGNATSLTTLRVRNGSTSGTIELCPGDFDLPDPGCTGNQRMVITSVQYNNVVLDDQLPPDITAGPQQLGNFGPVQVFIQVP